MPTSDSKPLPKILYIDDNADGLLLIGRLMRGRYRMFEAQDPLAGIQLAGEIQPDLVLLDMNLPIMDGIEVAIHLRKILKPGTPIVAFSAHFDPDTQKQALAVGFCGFMNKPIEIDTFYKQIDAFLARDTATLPDASTRP